MTSLHCIDVARRLSDGRTELSCSCERTFTDTPELSALDAYRTHRADPEPEGDTDGL